jgi:hypothetical protein
MTIMSAIAPLFGELDPGGSHAVFAKGLCKFRQARRIDAKPAGEHRKID